MTAMYTVFHEHLWDVAKYIAILFAIINAILNTFRRPQTKKLGYEVILSKSLSIIDRETGSNLQVRYPTEQPEHAKVLLIELANYGRTPIISEDFVRPILISFGSEARLITATVVKEEPEGLSVSVQIVNGNVQIDPLLLNPKDRLTLEAIIVARRYKVRMIARIAGVQKITSSLPHGNKNALMLLSLVCILAAIIIGRAYPHKQILFGFLLAVGIAINYFTAITHAQLREVNLKSFVGARYRN